MATVESKLSTGKRVTRPELDLRLGNYHRCTRQRILVVEDEQSISEPLLEHLRREGFDAEVMAEMDEAYGAWSSLSKSRRIRIAVQ